MTGKHAYTINPLGDTAVSINYGNCIDAAVNGEVMALYHYLRKHPLRGIVDLVPAYSSLTLFYDPVAYLKEINDGINIPDLIGKHLLRIMEDVSDRAVSAAAATISIPVCYEGSYAPDLNDVAASVDLTIDEVINLHTSPIYQVYMLGFLPGFAYMGTTADAIAVARKQRPAPIVRGSVGIAGRQTGIYPMASPGGWQIIGRTPLSLFTPATGHTLLQPGDRVQFYPISSYEFDHY